MQNDKYANFKDLYANERNATDYRIASCDRESNILIMAPHGGRIEPWTSEIAREIARDDQSFFSFEGVRHGLKHHELHVTSHKYDEPLALTMAAKSDRIVAVHGRGDAGDPETTWIGGLDTGTGELIAHKLQESGFKCEVRKGPLGGTHPSNICNRGKNSQGVQLELPRSLRDALFGDAGQMRKFSDAIRSALAESI